MTSELCSEITDWGNMWPRPYAESAKQQGIAIGQRHGAWATHAINWLGGFYCETRGDSKTHTSSPIDISLEAVIQRVHCKMIAGSSTLAFSSYLQGSCYTAGHRTDQLPMDGSRQSPGCGKKGRILHAGITELCLEERVSPAILLIPCPVHLLSPHNYLSNSR